jgi:hypothetical protein
MQSLDVINIDKGANGVQYWSCFKAPLHIKSKKLIIGNCLKIFNIIYMALVSKAHKIITIELLRYDQ